MEHHGPYTELEEKVKNSCLSPSRVNTEHLVAPSNGSKNPAESTLLFDPAAYAQRREVQTDLTDISRLGEIAVEEHPFRLRKRGGMQRMHAQSEAKVALIRKTVSQKLEGGWGCRHCNRHYRRCIERSDNSKWPIILVCRWSIILVPPRIASRENLTLRREDAS